MMRIWWLTVRDFALAGSLHRKSMLFTSLLAFAIALLSLFSQSLKAYFILDELLIAGELLYVCPNLTQSKL
ncbi:hypothetical protein ES332_A11G268600v1 [Gossypium tomentosum]|uniref:Uncharacterized protein n=1 Tax=Gossypium tomentosum TaxID=34277 RepID=A0A5D2NEG8_GOSTO|nr:hypothetical protein ES332_A11G268600v1 [Gossypium tomentosum]